MIIDRSFPGVNHKYRLSDNPEVVAANVDYIKEYLKAEELLMLHQIHSNHVLPAHDKNITLFRQRPEGDGIVTSFRNVALAILTADCVPIFFVDPENMVIGLTHAGWKGAKSGIIAETVKRMKQIGADTEKIKTLIGPCIHQASYEVGADFCRDFILEDKENERFFIESANIGHKMFDLPGYARARLQQAGIIDICQIPHDTFVREDLYPSYRRSTLRGEVYSESILSVLMME